MGPKLNTFTNTCSTLRTEIKETGVRVQQLIQLAKETTEVTETSNRGEMIANVTIAYRSLEDAAMRLGKAIQANETGQSIYDHNDSMRAAGIRTQTSILPASAYTHPKIVYYGPHPCQKCDPEGLKGTLIVKAGNGAPDDFEFEFGPNQKEEKSEFSYPYPSTHPDLNWMKHEHVA